MASGSGSDRVPKKDRREAARETARIMREEAAKRAKRRKWIVQGSVSVAVIAVLAIIALVIVSSIKPAGPGPKNMASGGIVLTSTTKAVTSPAQPANATPVPTDESATPDKAHIIVYLDYQCPICNQFETTNATQLGQWIDGGLATLEIHPVAILDASSNGNRYSTRAANAASCVANSKPSAFFAVNSALFKNQPAENGNGMKNDKLLSILKGAGASSDAITKCVNDEPFSSWITARTKAATSDKNLVNPANGYFGTPTVLVNGTMYTGSVSDASVFASFVQQTMAAGSGGSTSTPTPTATPAG
ncbi:DsbA family protein [Leifsonia sp. Root112D2]|uniref:DsbA family protein n=1 Tax=Leifsonia sp. Root112D2 TaxID=1736426 RepID=UPI000A515E0A|nr:thioredoxin domain-containing protein [Leifsonia sp. Root112D2]